MNKFIRLLNPFKWFKKKDKNIAVEENKKYTKSISVFNKTITFTSENCFVDEQDVLNIPDGTYTALTFKKNKLVNVGQAPLAKYTPRDNIEFNK